MATSPQWRHAGLLLLGATLVVLFIGSVDAGKYCPSGYKTCKPGYKHGGGGGCETCIKTDVNNCGDCGKKCKELPYTTVKCNYGHCDYTCTPGWANCDHKLYYNGCEKDVRNDVYNCGSCDKECKKLPYTDVKCKDGECDYKCTSGWGNCDHQLYPNGCEKDLRSDVFNCGSCGNCCPVTLKGGEATCRNGQCGQQCKYGYKYDDGSKCCVKHRW